MADRTGLRDAVEPQPTLGKTYRQFAAFLANFRALLVRQLGEVDGLQAYAQTAAQSPSELVLKKQA